MNSVKVPIINKYTQLPIGLSILVQWLYFESYYIGSKEPGFYSISSWNASEFPESEELCCNGKIPIKIEVPEKEDTLYTARFGT